MGLSFMQTLESKRHREEPHRPAERDWDDVAIFVALSSMLRAKRIATLRRWSRRASR
jgi:hypothetical protein